MGYFSEMRSYREQLGPLRFWSLLIGTILFASLVVGGRDWLSYKLGWPDSYGFHCSGRCAVTMLIQSPKLLRGGSASELALFALLWWWLILFVGAMSWALVTRLRRKSGRPRG